MQQATTQASEAFISIYARFNKLVQQLPDVNAITYHTEKDEHRSLSYIQLSEQVDQLSEVLLQVGALAGDRIVLHTDRSEQTLVALLAILKIRAVYVPVDMAYTPKQLRHIVHDVKASVVLCTQRGAVALQDAEVAIIRIDQLRMQPNLQASSYAAEESESAQEAFILYTSGTTGAPKGVRHGQGQLLNRFNWLWDQYPLQVGDVMVQRTILNFLPSLWELLGGLLQGVQTVMLHDNIVKNPARLLAAIAEHQISHITMVPTLLQMLLDSPGFRATELASVRHCITAGEPLKPALLSAFRRKLPQVTLLNDYGCTETNGTLWFDSAQPCEEGALPLFQPIANLQVYLLSEAGEPVATGEQGEICIAGPALAQGYVNLPEEEAKKFKHLQLSGQEEPVRIYQTGDLAIAQEAGHYQLKGRKDKQVKIKGIRTEISAVEDVLQQHAAVKAAAVIAIENEHGEQQLKAFVTLQEELEDAESVLVAHAQLHISSLVSPRIIVPLQEIPRLANGKTDYKALEAIKEVVVTEAKTAPTASALEEAIAVIAAQTLNIDLARINLQKKFYAVGFDSVSITRFVNNLNQSLQADFAVTELYSHATITDLAAFAQKSKTYTLGAESAQQVQAVSVEVEKLNEEPAVTPEPVAEVTTPAAPVAAAPTQEAPEPVPATPKAAPKQPGIAVIGMAGRFPQAQSVDEFWQNLLAQRDCVGPVPPERWQDQSFTNSEDAHAQWEGGFLPAIDTFDAPFFHLSYKEADLMDPQQRLLLEECWKAIEDAGITEQKLSGSRVGVFVGARQGDYLGLVNSNKHPASAQSLMGNDMAILSSRIAYHLNLKGPSLTIDTACSSSLVALHLACQSLRQDEADYALVAGVNLFSSPWIHSTSQQLGMLAQNLRCKPFDQQADGIVPSEAVAAIVLKKEDLALLDKDRIYARIIGSGTNQDGKTNGITAPNGESQEQLIKQVYAQYDIDPASISFIEAHGTGTKLGDPIEVAALQAVYGAGKRAQSVYLGSVKANIGHTIASAGITGLIKTICCMQQEQLPGLLHYQQENEHLQLAKTAFALNSETIHWPFGESPKRAAINSFGFSGTNSHVVVEEASRPEKQSAPAAAGYLIVLSAKTAEARNQKVQELLQWLPADASASFMANLAYTLLLRRTHFEELVAWVVKDLHDLRQQLSAYQANAQTIHADLKQSGASLLSKSNHTQQELEQLAVLYLQQPEQDWAQLYAPAQHQVISLPAYPFAQRRHWYEKREQQAPAQPVEIKEEAIPAARVVEPTPAPQQQANGTELKVAIETWLKEILAEATGIPVAEIKAETALEYYGIDSPLIMSLNKMLEKRFQKLPATLFFEHQSLAALTQHLHHTYGEALQALLLGIEPKQNIAHQAVQPIAEAVQAPVVQKQLAEQGLPAMAPLQAKEAQEAAIIGLTGRYPQARNLNEFWQNLCSGMNCVTEIPDVRWNLADVYDARPGSNGKIYGRWGSFIEGVDEFDPLFFGISPKEAMLMDPQERMLLQAAWHTLEDAGYTRQMLSEARTGVYIGVSWSEYQLLANEAAVQDPAMPRPNCSYATLANRISYHFNLNGPSMAVDTMCSSSLSALHLAWQALQQGEIDYAFVGGVNLSLHPTKYHLLSQGKYLSTEGLCRSFGADGDGYVPGEGLGMLLLTTKSRAVTERANLYGSIKATAINHGGKTNGYSVPNPNAQAAVISESLHKAGVSAAALGYVEAHGTGTALGDPIEITGLSHAYEADTDDTQYCAIGSLKSNIGHLEAAAGIAGLSKLLLQLKHQQLVPSLHATHLNPNIDFTQSPFYVNQELQPWEAPADTLRLGAISSFGAGGANAHLIVEEAETLEAALPSFTKQLFLLSAKTEEGLGEQVQNLYQYLSQSLEREQTASAQTQQTQSTVAIIQRLVREISVAAGLDQDSLWAASPAAQTARYLLNQQAAEALGLSLQLQPAEESQDLASFIALFHAAHGLEVPQEAAQASLQSPTLWHRIAYTLQVGRETLEHRLAILAADEQELLHKLQAWQKGETVPAAYEGHTKKGKGLSGQLQGETAMRATLAQLMERQAWEQLASLWSQGLKVDWKQLYKQEQLPQKLSLPGYPFKRDCHWLPIDKTVKPLQTPQIELTAASPTALRIARISETEATLLLQAADFYLADHLAGETPILPGAVYLEALQQVGRLCYPDGNFQLQELSLLQPCILQAAQETISLQLREFAGDWSIQFMQAGTLLAQAKLSAASQSGGQDSIPTVVGAKMLQQAESYACFRANEMTYGPGMQSIRKIDLGAGLAKATIQLPAVHAAVHGYQLHPALLDACFQTIIALVDQDRQPAETYLPAQINELQVYGVLPANFRATIQETERQQGRRRFRIWAQDEAGQLLLQIGRFTIRARQTSQPKPELSNITSDWPLYAYQENWQAEPLVASTWQGNMLLIDQGTSLQAALQQHLGQQSQVRLHQPHINLDSFEYDAMSVWLEGEEELSQLMASTQPETVVVYLNEDLSERSAVGLDIVNWLFQLSKAWLKAGAAQQKKQLLLCWHETQAHSPALRALVEYCKSVNLENRQCQFRSLALPEGIGANELSTYITRELASPDQKVAGVRYAQTERQVLRLAASNIDFSGQTASKPAYVQPGKNYLITGGLGKIGQMLTRHLLQVDGVQLFLTGRRPQAEGEAILRAEQWPARVHYLSCDVIQLAALEAAMAIIHKQAGALHGVLHCAGITHDAFIDNKTTGQFRQVAAPKVLGTTNLDLCTQAEPLDFFLNFSSIAATLGSAGQVDYAYANGYMDAYTHYREALRAAGKRQGASYTINWHLWQDGGMRVNEATTKLFEKTFGMYALTNQDAQSILQTAFAQQQTQFMVVKGEKAKIDACLGLGKQSKPLAQPVATEALAQPSAPPAPVSTPTAPAASATSVKPAEALAAKLTEIISGILLLDPQDIDLDTYLNEFGFDSVSFTEFANGINEVYQTDLLPAVFFEYQSLSELLEHLLETYPDNIAAAHLAAAEAPAPVAIPAPTAPLSPTYEATPVVPTPEQVQPPVEAAVNPGETNSNADYATEPIAIIGMSGLMPGAADLDAFWEVLQQEQSVIKEVDPARWDWQNLPFGESLNDRQHARYMGAAPDIDQFDPTLFSISPAEAPYIDPQHRLMLHAVWSALEQAGIRPMSLAGSNTGVYLGVATSDYDHMLRDLGEQVNFYATTGNSHALLANRISYYFDWHGPSEPVNVACASSLVAIHKAVKALREGQCKVCIAGGANIILDASTQTAFYQSGVLSEQGRTASLSAGADGYVRGEGLGAVVLKPLSAAIKDGDPIQAIIRESHMNHNGRVNTLTTPNPKQQAELLVETYRKAQIDPATLGYIELQGVGIAMADQLEVNALKAAFEQLAPDFGSRYEPGQCGIGTVKSVIGHLEAASGMASLFKSVLSLQHGKRLATLGASPINPDLRLEGSPFRVIEQQEAWPASTQPRRVGINAFGFGGVNAHLIIEGYEQAPAQSRDVEVIITLSARKEESLRQSVVDLLAFAERRQKLPLESLASTLQLGREAMARRLAFVCDSQSALVDTLRSYLAGQTGRVFLSDPGKAAQRTNGKPYELPATHLSDRAAKEVLAQDWVQKQPIDWQAYYNGVIPARIPAPGYPYDKQRYWINQQSDALPAAPASQDDQLSSQLKAIAAAALQLPEEDIDDATNLLHYGMDSLTGKKFIQQIGSLTGNKMSMQTLFEQPSISELSAYLSSN